MSSLHVLLSARQPQLFSDVGSWKLKIVTSESEQRWKKKVIQPQALRVFPHRIFSQYLNHLNSVDGTETQAPPPFFAALICPYAVLCMASSFRRRCTSSI